MNLCDLSAADQSAASAAATLEASVAAHPDERQPHTVALRSTLLLHARVKQLQGDTRSAQSLERSAEALDGAK